MKSIFLIVFFVVPIMIFGQDESSSLSKKEQKKLAKEKRNAEQAAQNEKQAELTGLMIDYQRFVLEADNISNQTGSRVPVSSTLNFIIVDSTKATLQLGSPWGVGVNGVGGITVNGRVTRYEVKKKEHHKGNNYSLTLYIMTSYGTYDIQIWVTHTGRADATVRGNYSGQLTYYGQLVPLSKSRIYKGTSIP